MKAKINFKVPEPNNIHPQKIKDFEIDYSIIENLFDSAIIEKKYNNYLRDKKIIIVGPAGYLNNKLMGEKIDNYDIVVRFNKSYPVNKTLHKSIGTRTDIWYHNMAQGDLPSSGGHIIPKELESNGVKWVSTHFPRNLSYFEDDITECEKKLQGSNINFHTHSDLEQYITFHSILETRPNLGVGAILDILSYDIKSLHISGLTFFKGGYMKGVPDRDEAAGHGDLIDMYQKDLVTNHAQKPQRILMKTIFENDSRITIDDEVKESLL
tara:strand:+ start:2919 stop:3719 length:801 start_codon:yes stop_codon:yes gene_type:complete